MNRAILSGLALLVLPLSAAIAQNGTFEMTPGVMVDRSTDALYLMRPSGGVERISISSGDVSWTSDKAGKPIAFYDGLLIAQAEKLSTSKQLEILLLDTASGEVAQTLRADLPEGVIAGIDDGLGRKFTARGMVVGGVPMVAWEQTERYSGGAAPSTDQTMKTRQEAAYRVDVQASKLVTIEPAIMKAAAPMLPASVRGWSPAGAAAEAPAATGSVFAAIENIGSLTTPESRILLKRWDNSGQPLPDLELFSGPHILQLRSADGLHLLVTDRAAPGTAKEYEWSVFSLETGERVGQLRHRRSHSRFFVSDGSLVLIEMPYGHVVNGERVLESLQLHAVSLDSEATLWQHPLRDTSFKGQVPP